MQTGCRPILLLLLVLPLTHSGAGDFLETGEMSSGALDMRVSETVEAGWRHSEVHTTFEFYLPYFVPGEDAELMHTAASDDEGSIMIFIGSWGMEDPYPEGFMEDLAVTVNGIAVPGRDRARGWMRYQYADGTENLVIIRGREDFNIGGWNTVGIEYTPETEKPGGKYYEGLYFDVGRFYSPINVSAEVGPGSGGGFNITFTVRNTGEATKLGPLKLYAFFNGSVVAPTQVGYGTWSEFDSGAERAGDFFSAPALVAEAGLNFSGGNEKNITLRVEEELGMGTYQVVPAYSYCSREDRVVFLEEAEVAKRGKIIIVGSSENTCRLNGQEGGCGFAESLEELGDAFARDGYDAVILDINDYDSSGWKVVGDISDSSAAVRGGIWREVTEQDEKDGAYVLVVGDFKIVPPCLFEDGIEGGHIYSDACYGIRPGQDYPTLAVSRIPYRTFGGNGSAGGELGAYMESMKRFHAEGRAEDESPDGVPCFSAVRIQEMPGENTIPPAFGGEEYVPPDGMDGSGIVLANPGMESPGLVEEILGGIFGWGPKDRSEISLNRHPIQFYFMHSWIENVHWLDSGKEILVSENTWPEKRFIVFSSACYGARYGNAESVPRRWMEFADAGIPNVFIGSTSVSHYGAKPGIPVGSDIISGTFYGHLQSGEESGRALLKAKQAAYDYDYEGLPAWQDLMVSLNSAFIDPKLSEMNRRAVLVYDMYGDPTIRAEDICGDYDEGET